MRQAVTTAVRTVTLGEVVSPASAGPSEAVLAIASVGICGSDIGMWAAWDPYATFPIRQGHEFSGRVLELGSGYDGPITVGDLVAVEPLLPDRTCIACRRGHPNCCRNLRVFGAHLDGALAERLVVPIGNLYPVGELTGELAAFVEPISIGLQMARRARVTEGDQVVVFGAGPIGQAVQIAAGSMGARLLSVDIVPERLQRARDNGAEVAVDGRADDLDERIADWTEGDGPVIVFEATGVPRMFRRAVDVVAYSGTVVVAGISDAEVTLPTLMVVKKEINLLGSRNNTGLYGDAVDLVQRERLRCEALITQRFRLDQVQEAMEFGEAHPDLANKMMIQIGA